MMVTHVVVSLLFVLVCGKEVQLQAVDASNAAPAGGHAPQRAPQTPEEALQNHMAPAPAPTTTATASTQDATHGEAAAAPQTKPAPLLHAPVTPQVLPQTLLPPSVPATAQNAASAPLLPPPLPHGGHAALWQPRFLLAQVAFLNLWASTLGAEVILRTGEHAGMNVQQQDAATQTDEVSYSVGQMQTEPIYGCGTHVTNAASTQTDPMQSAVSPCIGQPCVSALPMPPPPPPKPLSALSSPQQIRRGSGQISQLTEEIRATRIRRAREIASQGRDRTIEWLCSICGKTNFLRSNTCRSCGRYLPLAMFLCPGDSAEEAIRWRPLQDLMDERACFVGTGRSTSTPTTPTPGSSSSARMGSSNSTTASASTASRATTASSPGATAMASTSSVPGPSSTSPAPAPFKPAPKPVANNPAQDRAHKRPREPARPPVRRQEAKPMQGQRDMQPTNAATESGRGSQDGQSMAAQATQLDGDTLQEEQAASAPPHVLPPQHYHCAGEPAQPRARSRSARRGTFTVRFELPDGN